MGASARILVSDADRGRFADVLGDAFAEGRLTRDEYDERLTTAMAARTVADLVPVLDGLPPAAAAAALAPLAGGLVPAPAPGVVADVRGWGAPAGAAAASSSVVAVFGAAARKGQWVVPASLTTVALFGGVELDLTAATFTARETEIIAGAIFGGIEITVPEGLAVQVDGIGVFGGFDQRAAGPGDPGAPLLRVRGGALFGGVEVKRRPRRVGPGQPDRPALP
jgi:hypothetical protein